MRHCEECSYLAYEGYEYPESYCAVGVQEDELSFYDEDSEVIFEVDDELEPESITETKDGWYTVRINSKLKPTFIGHLHGDCYVELGLEV